VEGSHLVNIAKNDYVVKFRLREEALGCGTKVMDREWPLTLNAREIERKARSVELGGAKKLCSNRFEGMTVQDNANKATKLAIRRINVPFN
jgi:hypothetical protein